MSTHDEILSDAIPDRMPHSILITEVPQDKARKTDVAKSASTGRLGFLEDRRLNKLLPGMWLEEPGRV
jgi:hypothetical protein